MRVFLSLVFLALVILVIGCTPKPMFEDQTPPVLIDEVTGEQCAEYDRNGVSETHCATCGNNVCEPFESCTPTSCTLEACTKDCGQLVCEQDCVHEQEPPQLQPNVLPEITLSLRTCNKDEDCTKVDADCCGCTAGGETATLNKASEKKWQQTIDVKCKDIMCPAVMSEHWSCFIEPKCVKNRCTLVKE